MKQTIRLTERELRQMISESVKRVLKEDHKYTQLKNILGVNDNDEWNAAAECERQEDLESEIWRELTQLCGGNPRECDVEFNDVVNMLKEKFGFNYVGCNEEQESHIFKNGQDELEIFPKWFYKKQAKMTIYNTLVS